MTTATNDSTLAKAIAAIDGLSASLADIQARLDKIEALDAAQATQ